MCKNKEKFLANIDTIKKRLGVGENIKIISEDIGIDYHILRYYTLKYGLKKSKLTKLTEVEKEEIKHYYNLGATKKSVIEYLTKDYETAKIRSIGDFYTLINTKKKGNSHLGLYELLEIEKLYKKGHNVPEISKITRLRRNKLQRLFNNLKWNNIKKPRKKKIQVEDKEKIGNLYKFVKEADILLLSGYGADFLVKKDNKNILIECKTTLTQYSLSNAILQLIFGKNEIEKEGHKIDEMWIFFDNRYAKLNIVNYHKYFLKKYGIKFIKGT